MPYRDLEPAVAHIGRELQAHVRQRRSRRDRAEQRILDVVVAEPAARARLFQLVDAFPALRGSEDVSDHIAGYLDEEGVPAAMRLAVRASRRVPGGDRVSAAVARWGITHMASRFIAGTDAAAARPTFEGIWTAGMGVIVDLLGEKTITQADADRYAARVAGLIEDLRATPGEGRRSIAIKPTALAPRLHPLTAELGLAEARERLVPILRAATAADLLVWFDMEQFEVKDLTLTLFRSLLGDPELAAARAGIVIQAYLRDSTRDLADLLAWSAAHRRRLSVRLVKGAYWDAETVLARAHGWPVPVYEHKGDTDASFERGTRLLLEHRAGSDPTVQPAFASHNVRSIAHAIAVADDLGLPRTDLQLQMLHGMEGGLAVAVRSLGPQVDVYAPVGDLVPGMAYLVRRLLENSSNESFVRQTSRQVDGDVLLRATVDDGRRPQVGASAGGCERAGGRGVTELPPYAPEPVRRWHDPAVRAAFAAAVEHQAVAARELAVPTVIGGRRVATERTVTSVDPGRTDHVVAVSARVDARLADDAVAVAVAAAPRWAVTPAGERAEVLVRAAASLRQRRDEVAALQVFEAGKPWAEADADVCEAIDFCEYYAREALRLDLGGTVQSPPGERNRLTYRARGVAAVIAPWNFPLAIPTGMVTAALAAGNAVCLKPAEQTPAIAQCLVAALEAGGLPEGVLSFLPGVGEEVGAHLVEHPDVSVIAFTGSRPVGLSILRAAAAVGVGQRQIKRAITELGGKNPIIVDADADPDEAVPGIAAGAFAFAGQKCSAASRLIVHRAVYEPIVRRLVAHTELMELGRPRAPGVIIGPVIDTDAHERLLQTQRRADGRFRVRSWRDEVPEGGWYVGPMIVDEVPASDPLATDEHFGPVLVVAPADSIDDAFAMANATDYALTAGLYSRSPVTIARAGRELRAGNIYLNRGTTGAVVGRQPFGGFGLSGIGSKAGGPDYLAQFCDPVAVTENTLRQGFAADQLTA